MPTPSTGPPSASAGARQVEGDVGRARRRRTRRGRRRGSRAAPRGGARGRPVASGRTTLARTPLVPTSMTRMLMSRPPRRRPRACVGASRRRWPPACRSTCRSRAVNTRDTTSISSPLDARGDHGRRPGTTATDSAPADGAVGEIAVAGNGDRRWPRRAPNPITMPRKSRPDELASAPSWPGRTPRRWPGRPRRRCRSRASRAPAPGGRGRGRVGTRIGHGVQDASANGFGPNGLARPSLPGLRMPFGSSAVFTELRSTSRPAPSASGTNRARLMPDAVVVAERAAPLEHGPRAGVPRGAVVGVLGRRRRACRRT